MSRYIYYYLIVGILLLGVQFNKNEKDVRGFNDYNGFSPEVIWAIGIIIMVIGWPYFLIKTYVFNR